MSKIYQAFVYVAIGAVAYIAAGEMGGPAGVALAQSGGKCPAGDCCNTAYFTQCCKSNDNCSCQGQGEWFECETDDGSIAWFDGICGGKICQS